MTLVARMRRRLGAQGGYTLVEMLTVLLILGVVMGGLTTVLASATNADAENKTRSLGSHTALSDSLWTPFM